MRPRRLNMYVFPLAMRTRLSSHESLAPVLADYTAIPSPAGRVPYPCDRARHLDHTRSAGVDEADSVRMLSIGQTQAIDVFCFAESQSPRPTLSADSTKSRIKRALLLSSLDLDRGLGTRSRLTASTDGQTSSSLIAPGGAR